MEAKEKREAAVKENRTEALLTTNLNRLEMKKITIKKALIATDIGDENTKLTAFEIEGPEEMDASDGYHTFTELYDHRIELFIALGRKIVDYGNHRAAADVWRSKKHSDGTMFDGWFVMGIGFIAGEQITYHLPTSRWEDTGFCKTLEAAPEWDGHTPQDVIERLKSL